MRHAERMVFLVIYVVGLWFRAANIANTYVMRKEKQDFFSKNLEKALPRYPIETS
jgi:hypothetical protein